MNNFFRAIIAGYGAKKLGGGCLGTIIVFVLIWVALGQCSFSSREQVPRPETFPAEHRVSIPLEQYSGLLAVPLFSPCLVYSTDARRSSKTYTTLASSHA